MTNALYALAVMGLLGAYDTLVYHELVARLPHRTTAQRELQLHAARDFVYMTLFATLAWLEPHGALVLVLGVLLLTEIAITLSDFLVEDHTRRLPGGRVAAARRNALRSGSTFNTIPGPPPNASSSTWRWRSLACSRRSCTSSVISPDCRARPTTPAPSGPGNSSGKIVST